MAAYSTGCPALSRILVEFRRSRRRFLAERETPDTVATTASAVATAPK